MDFFQMKAETVARIDAALRRRKDLDRAAHRAALRAPLPRLRGVARKGDERRLHAHQHGVARFACRLARLSKDPSAEFVVDVSKASDLLESTTGAMR